MIKSDSQKRVAVFFMENLSVKLMETLLNVLGTIRRGEMVTERVAALSLNYLILWYEFGSIWIFEYAYFFWMKIAIAGLSTY